MDFRKEMRLLGLCAALACGVATRAEAQCSQSCNRLADHMFVIGNWSFADHIRFGTVQDTDGLWYAAACRWDSGWGWVLEGIGLVGYASPVVEVDTSLCTGGGNDTVESAGSDGNGGPDTVCLTPNFEALVLNGLALAPNTRFSISGEAGNDTIVGLVVALSSPGLPTAGANICGGTGNDILIGSNGDDYISGQENNDYLDGFWGTDNLKAASGNDVLVNPNRAFQGADKLRGETGDDCISVDAPISSGSSCGGEPNDHYRRASGITVPADCGTRTPNCCTLSGRTCPGPGVAPP
jgi:Ca2+-binding RTX toxin-like protein